MREHGPDSSTNVDGVDILLRAGVGSMDPPLLYGRLHAAPAAASRGGEVEMPGGGHSGTVDLEVPVQVSDSQDLGHPILRVGES